VSIKEWGAEGEGCGSWVRGGSSWVGAEVYGDELEAESRGGLEVIIDWCVAKFGTENCRCFRGMGETVR
jgi:hypothetical protein